MNCLNSTKRFLLGLFLVLSLQHTSVAQTPDSLAAPVQTPSETQEPYPQKTSKEPEAGPETEKPNHKLIAAVCLFIITTTLLLYHVRSK